MTMAQRKSTEMGHGPKLSKKLGALSAKLSRPLPGKAVCQPQTDAVEQVQITPNANIASATRQNPVGAKHVVSGPSILFGRLETGSVDFNHDVFQALFAVIEAPGILAGVLLHFQSAGCDAICIAAFAGPNKVPVSRNNFTASGVNGILAPSATVMVSLRINSIASEPVSSF